MLCGISPKGITEGPAANDAGICLIVKSHFCIQPKTVRHNDRVSDAQLARG
jgi:hypothetical protein